MSLVNLAHVCSHLQNASLARLGLTSIPYSKLHLSFALLLHKQGFLSQVKLGGPSPPASCFPPGQRDTRSTTGLPYHHEAGSMHSPESALQRVVAGPGPVTEEILRKEGFGDAAITFAMEERFKSKEQLEREGWAEIVGNFFLQHERKTREQLLDEGLTEEQIFLVMQHKPRIQRIREEVKGWYTDQEAHDNEEAQRMAHGGAGTGKKELGDFHEKKAREQFIRESFSTDILRYFAGPQNSLRSERDLARDGFTIRAMGLEIPNQPWNPPPPPSQSDPWQLEEEGVVTQANRASRRLWLGLKYWDGMPVLRKAQMLSKPTKRYWLTARELGGLTRGFAAARGEVKPLTQVGECVAVTTDRGVMEVREAAEKKVGGMVLCRVW